MTPLEGALAAIAAGWPVFPLAARSKVPAVSRERGGKGVHDASLQADPSHRGNWGVACGPAGLTVVDIDPKTGGTAQHAAELPPTFTVRTPSGGWHLYYAGASANRTGLIPGVDIRAAGGYVVAPGSIVNGVAYTIERPLPIAEAPAWLLAAIGAPRAVDPDASPTSCPAHLTRDDRWLEHARAHLRNLPPAVTGEGGAKLYAAAAILQRGWLLPQATVDALLRAEYNPRCVPPWDFSDSAHANNWQHTLDRAERISDVQWGEKRPRLSLDRFAERPGDLVALASAPAPTLNGGGARTWTLLEGSLMGAPQSVERALKLYRRAVQERRDPGTEPELTHSSAVIKWLVGVRGWTPDRVASELGRDAGEFAVTLRAPEVQSVGRLTKIDTLLGSHELRWNEMSLSIEIDGERWTDTDTARVRLALEQCGASDPEKPIPNGDIEQRARALAVPYHPVAEYLASLPPWDGVPRVEGLWVRYFGAEDCDLNRKLGACFAIGAVRRVLEPGTKVDMMPILFGDQGSYKSSGLSALVGGPPFFTDAAPGFGHRSENAMTVAGCWVWEIAEMQGMDRADQNAVKAFVTRCEDDVLLPYARAKARLYRRSVTIGTTNDESCLNDPTGSRRHPVIEIGTIDRGGLSRDRDLFWSEAKHRAASGEPHWLSSEDERLMGERNIEKHTRTDDMIVIALEAWFELPPEKRLRTEYERKFPPRDEEEKKALAAAVARNTFTVRDVVQFALGGRSDQGTAARVGAALKRMGVAGKRTGKKRIYRYLFP